MDKQILQLAKQLADKQAANPQQETVKDNNKPIREYTKAEKMVFNLAKKNLDELDAAFRNAIASELHCAEIIKDAQPIGDDFDKYYRIVEVISRFSGAWENSKYQGKAPETKRSLIDSLKPVNKLK